MKRYSLALSDWSRQHSHQISNFIKKQSMVNSGVFSKLLTPQQDWEGVKLIGENLELVNQQSSL